MGKFDGILICSDWDGTLFCGGEVPRGSVEAIKYFQSEGGIFTICSGRQPSFLREYGHFVTPNTYALCYNGALICDLESGEIGTTGQPSSDVLYYTLANEDKIIVRPSGTEPKIKIYILAHDDNKESLDSKLSAYEKDSRKMTEV